MGLEGVRRTEASEGQNNLPKVTELKSGRPGI